MPMYYLFVTTTDWGLDTVYQDRNLCCTCKAVYSVCCVDHVCHLRLSEFYNNLDTFRSTMFRIYHKVGPVIVATEFKKIEFGVV